MARRPRDSRIETREARSRLKVAGTPYWKHISTGLAVGYYKGKRGGAWYSRRPRLEHEDGAGRWKVRKLAAADDYETANGADVLDYGQAVKLAMSEGIRAETGEPEPRMTSRRERQADAAILADCYTVANAIADYVEAVRARKPEGFKVYSLKAHVLPKFGERPVADLTAEELQRWHDRLAKSKTPSTAKRVWGDFRAALNHAFRYRKASSDSEWRRVRVSRNADQGRLRYLSTAEAKRLLNACDAEFRPLVRAALLTGARYGELVTLQARDFDTDAGTVRFAQHKTGSVKHVPLSDEGRAWFRQWTAGKPGTERLFLRLDGEPWDTSHQIRRMKAASTQAKLDPPATFHDLRRTYGSLLALEGVPLKFIADALGHRDTRMAEKHYAHLQRDSAVAEAIRENLPSFGKAPRKVAVL